MRRLACLPLICILALVTAVALLRTAALLGDSGTPAAAASADTTVVRAFYAAVNEALRHGDPGRLPEVIAADVVVGGAEAGAVSGRDGLARRLTELRAEAPGLRIVVEEVLTDRDRAVALVRLTGIEPTAFLAIPQDAMAGSVATDVFRIEAGRVVEYGGVAARLGAPRRLMDAVFEQVPAGPAFVGLARVTIEAGEGIPVLVGRGSTVYAVETGMLSVRIDGVGRVVRAVPTGAPPAMTPTIRGRAVTLRPGDRIAIGPAVSYALGAASGGPAAVLAAAIMPVGALTSAGHDSQSTLPSLPLSVAMYGPDAAAGAGADWPPGVVAWPLLGGVVGRLPTPPVAVALAGVAFAPGTTSWHHKAVGTELVAVESGRALLTRTSASDPIPVAPSATAPGATDGGGGEGGVVTVVAETTVLEAGAVSSLLNVGDVPLSVVLARIAPVEHADGRPVTATRMGVGQSGFPDGPPEAATPTS